MSTVASGTLVTPGQRLGAADEFLAGSGCYVSGPHIVASLVGIVQVSGKEMSVKRTGTAAEVAVPVPGDVVIGRVTKLTLLLANVDILCIGTTPLPQPFPGVIRQQDVRAIGETVEMNKCFRPGDIVRAEVLSFGDARNLFLTTAKNELGVIYAESEAGAVMVPVSWQEMQCTRTRAREFRKVAKPTA